MFFHVLPNEDDDPDKLITFWNPYDTFNATLTNRRQTITNTTTALNVWSGGWENLELTTGKYYFEIDVQQLDTNGLNNAMMCGWRNSQDGFGPNAGSSSDLTRVIYLGPDCHQLARWSSDIGTKIQASNTMTASTTNEFGYAEGDTLMFALDLDNAKAWAGKNGTWMNSGDPAAGTNPQWTGFLSGRSYRFWVEGFGYTNAILNARFGGTIFPQEYAAPAGFTSLLPKAATQVYGGWNVRSSSAEWQQGTDNLTDADFLTGAKLFTSGNLQWAGTVGRMRTGEKFYFEAYLASDNVSNIYRIGVGQLGAVSAYAYWQDDGTLGTTGGASSDSTGVVSYTTLDRLGFAVDVSAGKMWLRKPDGSWTNSGDPAAGTNPQFTDIPAIELVGHGMVSDYSGDIRLVHPDDFDFATPSGFTTGLPLHPLGLQ